MNTLTNSELIINPDGSIYHLCLKPGDIGEVLFSVGDPQRVASVSAYFDSIDLVKENREFIIHSGLLNGKRISVLSTGMGTDNIDIVWNEIDALFNINFENRKVKEKIQKITWIRLGTSGSIREETPVGEMVYSQLAIGLEGLMPYYEYQDDENGERWSGEIEKIIPHIKAYTTKCSAFLEECFKNDFTKGITATFGGFYAPQGRNLRIKSKYPDLMDQIASIKINNEQISNMEMETAGIYGLASILGHDAISLNAIIANRATGDFSDQSEGIMDQMIQKAIQIVKDKILI